ncbi:MAG TPA: DUF1810 domain-containing protein [Candidatus Cottocaccamicrobium excrementipullorum]|nr:DUF1810 domain-containing protein [Candidatus Cottocaccamicrobium excrementipullorum]
MADLTRFHEAQKGVYQEALREIRNGKKRSHWMWYIFPQIAGLGRSSMTQYYGIKGLGEAKEYLRDPILRERLTEISQTLLALETDDASQIFGWPDDMKLRSSMTLFSCADPGIAVFQKVLDKFFQGEKDELTLRILNH